MSKGEVKNIAMRDYLCAYLSFTHEREEAERLADALAVKYGSLAYIASSSAAELCATEGLSPSAALSLKLLSYVWSRSITDGFKLQQKHTEEEIKEFFRALFIGHTVETVYCMFLDRQERVIAVEYLGEGTVNTSEVYPRRVVERACALRAGGVILAHNHPKGTVLPSSQDLASTSYLKHILATSGISLLSHYLVNERECERLNFDEESVN